MEQRMRREDQHLVLELRVSFRNSQWRVTQRDTCWKTEDHSQESRRFRCYLMEGRRLVTWRGLNLRGLILPQGWQDFPLEKVFTKYLDKDLDQTC